MRSLDILFKFPLHVLFENHVKVLSTSVFKVPFVIPLDFRLNFLFRTSLKLLSECPV